MGHYNYFRDYDPSLGRYIESDPIGMNAGLNTFGYAYQSSLAYWDPRGLLPDCKPILYGPAQEVGQLRKNERRVRIDGGYEFDFGSTNEPLGGGPTPGWPDKINPGGGPKVCTDINMKFTVYRVYFLADEFDLYAKYQTMVTWRCEDRADCGKVEVNFHNLPELSEMFVDHKSTFSKERERVFGKGSGPTPVCLSAPGGPRRGLGGAGR